MKKTIFFATVAAVFIFTSCLKEETPEHKDLVFTATISDTKTIVDAAGGKVSWVLGDTITIIDKLKEIMALYKVSSIDNGQATFTKIDGWTELGSGPYWAYYKEKFYFYEQYYKEDGEGNPIAPSLPMFAVSEDANLDFKVTSGLLELYLKAGENVTRIEVTGSGNTYTLICSTPVDISSGVKFYIALPEGTYNKICIKGENGAGCVKSNAENPLQIKTGHITPASFTKELHFAVQLWKGGPYWATTNVGATSKTGNGKYFAWGYTDGQTWNGTSFTDKWFQLLEYPYKSQDQYEDMAAANWDTEWSVPANTDLKNLIDTTSYTSIEYVESGSAHWSEYKVNGLLITGKTAGYTSNSIFLPAAGYGQQKILIDNGDYCGYWSSVEKTNKDGCYSYILKYYRKQKVSLDVYYNYKYLGLSVRPVRSSL